MFSTISTREITYFIDVMMDRVSSRIFLGGGQGGGGQEAGRGEYLCVCVCVIWDITYST